MADKEYIERGAFLKKCAEAWGYAGVTIKAIEKIADECTTADVVKVVRCKDCIYNNGACTHSEIYDDTNYNPDYYCADGERKEQT